MRTEIKLIARFKNKEDADDAFAALSYAEDVAGVTSNVITFMEGGSREGEPAKFRRIIRATTLEILMSEE